MRLIGLLVLGLTLNYALFAFRQGEVAQPGSIRDLARPLTSPVDPIVQGDGAKVSLADWRGTPVVVTLWASWCEICRRELPALDKAAPQLAERGVAVVPISLDRGPAARQAAAAAHRQMGLSHLPLLWDREGAFGDQLGGAGVPATLLIDARGQIRSVALGALPWGDAVFLDQIASRVARLEKNAEGVSSPPPAIELGRSATGQ